MEHSELRREGAGSRKQRMIQRKAGKASEKDLESG